MRGWCLRMSAYLCLFRLNYQGLACEGHPEMTGHEALHRLRRHTDESAARGRVGR
jgi:hypothetical protein